MRILVACEESQAVTIAMRERGHEAYSCDILPCSGGYPEWHIQGDVLPLLNEGWDMMIAFPPCTYLTNAGIAHFNVERYGQKAIDRWRKRIEAFDFFMKLATAPIERIAIENPVGFANTVWRKPDQIIHPYYFGDPHMKRTCLWLKNLPLLEYQLQDDLFGMATATSKPEPVFIDNTPRAKKRYFSDAIIGYSNNHGYLRSKTFPGIAQAMAAQWA